MRLADQTASAKNTPKQKPAARYLPRPRAFAKSRRQRQRHGADGAGQAPRTPPCLLVAHGEPVRGHAPRRQPSTHAPGRPLLPEASRLAPLLGRAPYAFGYGYSLRVARACIKCFTSTSASLYLLPILPDRKSTRLNSSHSQISYAVFCLKKKKKTN